jgi:glycosyltransferase involved in cell wall biosynthesis
LDQPFKQVLVVANARIPGERAQSIQTVRTAAAFARTGIDTHLLYARRRVRRRIEGVGGDPLAYYGVKEAVHLHPIAVLDWIEAVPRRLQYLPARLEEFSFGWNAARAVARFPGALVHCREIEVGALLAERGHPSYLFEAHTVPGNRLRRRWMERALRGALGIVAITRGLAEDVAAAFRVPLQNICIVPDAYDPAGFESLPSRGDARARLCDLGFPAPGGKPLVVYTGHLFAWKGVDTLLAAAVLAPELDFRLVGGLPEDVARCRAEAARLKAGNVEVAGHRPPTEIPLHLAAADIVVIPNSAKQQISARHTSPLKLFEALAAKRPIVASDLESLREVLVAEKNALLVPPDNAGALASALRRLVADPALGERLATEARRESTRYSFDARASALLALAADRASRRGKNG